MKIQWDQCAYVTSHNLFCLYPTFDPLFFSQTTATASFTLGLTGYETETEREQ